MSSETSVPLPCEKLVHTPNRSGSRGGSGRDSREDSREGSREGPDTMRLRLVEPLRELYKDEVRALGARLELPRAALARAWSCLGPRCGGTPSPGPGWPSGCWAR